MRKAPSVRARRRDRKVMPPTLRYRSTSNSTSRGRKRACSRLRMRPWLEELLDREESSILRWENRDQKTFSIAWRHASSHGFDPSRHGDLFYRWAQHTGKMKRNTNGDHSSNKSTFRCALHSLKDCVELTKKGDKRGEGAKRTYQFIEPGHPSYDRKRKRANRKEKVLLKEETSVSSPDLQQESSNHSEYFLTEVSSVDMNITKSPGIPEPVNESSVYLPPYINNDLVALPPSMEQHAMTTSFDFSISAVPADNDQDPNYENRPQFLTTTPKLLTEYNPNGIVSLSLSNMDCNKDDVEDITFKEEPETPRLPDFFALDVPDTYDDLDSINNPSLCCGGNVRVKQIKQESLSQPEFQIDYSLIKTLPPQQLLLPPEKYYEAVPSGPDYECPVAETCVDVATEQGGDTDLEQSAAVDGIFPHVPYEDHESKVLTQLQPYISDSPYSAMIEAENFDDISDIFSIGDF
ncbi:hypothetical protein BsWGS_05906 [Bradybaena similaris]